MGSLFLPALLILRGISAVFGGQCIVLALPEAEKCYGINNTLCQTQLYPIQPPHLLNRAIITNFVSAVFHRSGNSCHDVIGVVGNLDSQTAAIIHTLSSRANLSTTLVAAFAPSSFLPVTNLDLPTLLDRNPLQHYVNALVGFMQQLNWKRIGLINEDTSYYLFAAEVVQKQLLSDPEVTVAPYIRISQTDLKRLQILLEEFRECGTEIILLITSKEMQCSLLSGAAKLGYTWPGYAVVWLDLDWSSSYCRACKMEEGIIILRKSMHRDVYKRQHLAAAPVSTSNNTCSNILQDSITSVLHSNSPNHSFEGATGRNQFREGKLLFNVSVVQVQACTDRVVGVYNSEVNQLDSDPNTLTGDEIPHGQFKVFRLASQTYNAITSCIIVLFLGLTSFNLVLYLLFRKEPEVKATSVSISMCMFLGCYLLIMFNIVLLIELQPIQHSPASARVICLSLAGLTLPALPVSLIFSTLIVKMLRVYLIFYDPLSYKKKLFTDKALLLYIFLLMLPVICILILVPAVEKLNKVRLTNLMKSYAVVHDRCLTKYSNIWLSLLLIYNFFLALAAAVIAVKTSKIRYKHFQDTKATNAFVYLSIFVAPMTLIYWSYFFTLPVSRGNEAGNSLFIGHCVEALLCQLILFLPKIVPPVKRWLSRNRVRRKV